ncbi:MAG: FecCD family ABC transporter permease [Gemmatimonadota bacterium]
MTNRPQLAVGGILVVLAVTALLGLMIGTVGLPPDVALEALLGRPGADETASVIVREIRLPRVLLGVLVGCALGMSGAALQGTLRNSLAEPWLLGVSGGAAAGAVAVVAFGAGSMLAMPVAAFGGAIAAVALVLAVARASVGAGHGDPRVLLMSGVVVGAFANAVILVLLAEADSQAARTALWWMMGSLASADWAAVRWLAVTILIAGGLLLHWAPEVDLLALGEESAASLGVDPSMAAPKMFLLSSLLAAATVAAAGLVGFVGLIVPHLARAIAGPSHRRVFVISALGGATLTVAADVVARTVRSPSELPLGAVTAILGVPFFLVVLRRAL